MVDPISAGFAAITSLIGSAASGIGGAIGSLASGVGAAAGGAGGAGALLSGAGAGVAGSLASSLMSGSPDLPKAPPPPPNPAQTPTPKPGRASMQQSFMSGAAAAQQFQPAGGSGKSLLGQ